MNKIIVIFMGVIIFALAGSTAYFAMTNKTCQVDLSNTIIAKKAVEKMVAEQPAAVKEESVPADWKTYSNKVGNISISLPSDWKMVMPADGSLAEISSDMLEPGNVSSVSSPDESENITITTTGSINTNNINCVDKFIDLEDEQKVREIICAGAGDKEYPGRYNYDYIGKNLVITADGKTEMLQRIISFIKLAPVEPIY